MQRRTINLTFHGIGDHGRRLDAGEEEVWLPLAQFLTVLDVVAERRDVRLTFDDGNGSDLEHALPALRERGLRATFFVVAGRLGVPGYVDASGVRALSLAGMTIGCHGMHHRPWRAVGDRMLHEELVETRNALEDIIEHPVVDAACPFGSYDRRVLRSLRRFGYRTIYTSDGGTAAPDAWIQARTTVGPRDGAGLVEQIIASERAWYQTLRRRTKQVAKRWR
jgi:peptidoglycan/xylan/chitin deacetylase (PgdA/CDA1 family)